MIRMMTPSALLSSRGYAERIHGLPTPADEGEPLEELLVIEPVAARAARRIGHEVGAFIIADGFYVYTGAL